jgi:predicted transcriptional regulator
MGQTITIQNFKLNQTGLCQIFGELEAKLMEAVWVLGSPSVKEVIEYWDEALHYKTTMTVLNRLVEKGILTRRRSGRGFVYQAVVTRDQLLADVVEQVVRGLFSADFREIALPQMVETAATIDPNILKGLSKLIKKEGKSLARGTILSGTGDNHAKRQ